MISQLKVAYSRPDRKFSSILLYCSLTGLRPAEAYSNLRLLKERKEDYLAKDSKLLEHFRFPSIFLRRTKIAYVSTVFERMLEWGPVLIQYPIIS